jgi:hypothetical protein
VLVKTELTRLWLLLLLFVGLTITLVRACWKQGKYISEPDSCIFISLKDHK